MALVVLHSGGTDRISRQLAGSQLLHPQMYVWFSIYVVITVNVQGRSRLIVIRQSRTTTHSSNTKSRANLINAHLHTTVTTSPGLKLISEVSRGVTLLEDGTAVNLFRAIDKIRS